MSVVFYRKYRSQDFSSLMGQSHIKEILTHAIINEKLAHAYLFCGPRGTGKTSTARIFAKAINCLNFKSNGDVCNTCEYCNLINSGTCIDVIEMDAASNRGIEEIRTLKENANYLPTMLTKKIYIIDEAHMLTKEAFNALLKTLEEPPAHILFILATTEPHKLPITILSRVQRYDFSLAQKDEVIKKLSFIAENEGLNVEEGVLELIYTTTGGSFRDAESIFNTISQAGNNITLAYARNMLGVVDTEILENLTTYLITKHTKEALNTFETITQKIQDYDVFVDYYVSFLTKKLIHFEENNSNDKLINIIQELLTIKYQLRDTRDKKGLIYFVLIKITNSKLLPSAEVITEHAQPEKVVRKTLKQITSSKQEESKPAAIPKDTVSEKHPEIETNQKNSFDIKPYISQIENEDKRLVAILKGSFISLNGSVLNIQNEFEFNVKHVKKPTSQKILLTALQPKGVEKIQVSKASAESFFNKMEEQTFKKEETIQEQIKPEPKKEEIDNSDLVESLL